MKKLVLNIAFLPLFFIACNNGASSNSNDQTAESSTSNTATEPESIGSPITGILDNYLSLQDALSKDNDKDAAAAGNEMVKAFANFDKASLTSEQAKVYNDIEADAREHAEHIGANEGNIKHQREHFETLSEEMYELVKAVGAGQKLYYEYCPMYNDNKGGYWISKTKEIQNPYFGKSMSDCGSVKEELK